MVEEITIQRAGLKDLESILTLWRCFMEYLSQKEPQAFHLKEDFQEKYRKRLPKILQDKRTLVLLGIFGDKTVGYHITSIRYPLFILKQKPFGQVSDLYILPDYRSFGIGSKLLKKSIAWLKEKGINELYMKTFYENREGIEFWKKQGFTPIEVMMRKLL